MAHHDNACPDSNWKKESMFHLGLSLYALLLPPFFFCSFFLLISLNISSLHSTKMTICGIRVVQTKSLLSISICCRQESYSSFFRVYVILIWQYLESSIKFYFHVDIWAVFCLLLQSKFGYIASRIRTCSLVILSRCYNTHECETPSQCMTKKICAMSTSECGK